MNKKSIWAVVAGVLFVAGLGPRWYPVLLAVLAIPQCWVGGRIYLMQSATH